MMSEEEMTELVSYNLDINENIARLTSEIDDNIMEVWKIDRKDIEEALNFRNNLIKYLEKKIENLKIEFTCTHPTYQFQLEERMIAYKDILERVRSGKYE